MCAFVGPLRGRMPSVRQLASAQVEGSILMTDPACHSPFKSSLAIVTTNPIILGDL